MGKGLSQLQKKILLLAYGDDNRNVMPCEVLISFYRFPLNQRGKLVFDRQTIGINRYKAATVAVCKSMDRLSERGLASKVPNQGVFLTKKGEKEAERLAMEVNGIPGGLLNG